MKDTRGFSLVEAVIALLVITTLSGIGYAVYNRLHTHNTTAQAPHRQVAQYIHATDADAQTILTNFYNVLAADFDHPANPKLAIMCSQTAQPSDENGCSYDKGIILDRTSGLPLRLVHGYDFYVSHGSDSSDTDGTFISIYTSTAPMTKAVLQVLANQITHDKLSTTTQQLSSKPQPEATTKTYYSNKALCELHYTNPNATDGARISFSCGPLQDYATAAANLAPAYDMYLKSHPEYANPTKSGKWLVLEPTARGDYSEPQITEL